MITTSVPPPYTKAELELLKEKAFEHVGQDLAKWQVGKIRENHKNHNINK